MAALKGEHILPEFIALIGGLIVFISCVANRKDGLYTFFITFIVCVILYVFGHVIKIILENKK